jgi:hypothetical protein
MSESGYKPTKSMGNNAKRGKEYREKNGGKGGTSVGMGMATKLINGTELTQAEVNKMHSFFSRHDGNQKVKEGKKPHEDAGYVAWLLWGGDSGKSWAAERASSNKKGSVSLMPKRAEDGLWDNINKKKERGEAPAKPGDEDYPDQEQWDKLTKESDDECWDEYERVPGTKAYEPGSCRKAVRMAYITDMNRQGECEVEEAKAGDRVKFLSAFERPGWPRVDAGELGRVRAVAAGSGMLEVEVTGTSKTAEGIEVKRHALPVPAGLVALMLHSEDQRAA